MATFGSGTLLAALNVKYRDFRYIIPFLIQFLLFVTPVIYPTTITDNKYLKILFSLNPMSAPLDIFRAGITNGGINWEADIASIASSVIIFILGLLYFKKTEAYFADLA
jgi:lipopolysaccharide transport system permease protein